MEIERTKKRTKCIGINLSWNILAKLLNYPKKEEEKTSITKPFIYMYMPKKNIHVKNSRNCQKISTQTLKIADAQIQRFNYTNQHVINVWLHTWETIICENQSRQNQIEREQKNSH